jgi:hypothetical protein
MALLPNYQWSQVRVALTYARERYLKELDELKGEEESKLRDIEAYRICQAY